MAAIVLNQQNCSKILVGDSHQQIYGFMGAVNALQQVHLSLQDTPGSLVSCTLTRSFRFGRSIAAVANDILRIKRVRGGGLDGSLVLHVRCSIARKIFNHTMN